MSESSGFGKVPTRTRIAVAMSGGVDSSVAAALLVERGHDVIGITMRLYESEEEAALSEVCGGGALVEDARQVAEKLGIPHRVLDLRRRFTDDVIKIFAGSYAHGETPNPCVLCNRNIKFGALLTAAQEFGCEFLATGHYARREETSEGPELHRAADESRDQSYFLFAVTRAQFSHLLFPLGKMSKPEVRALAGKYGLPVATKPDSQDICFVPEGDYANIVRQFHPEAFSPGEIVDGKGEVLGHHEGIVHFTVGQRRKLNIHDRAGENNEPLFVLRLEPETRRVVVGPRAALAQTEAMLRDVNWLGEDVPDEGIQVMARLRSAQSAVPARFFMKPGEGGRIMLKEPSFGVAPGQAGVVYVGTRVLGGGWIVAKA
ncbi:MAG: tRNA 2-thiouridine(34) synthase MnmA [Alphaproteobacteria bacterium]|nr:tRNA 2-thiouridine(34) synthase MnmA [Alphaproteobacteria bacterium]